MSYKCLIFINNDHRQNIPICTYATNRIYSNKIVNSFSGVLILMFVWNKNSAKFPSFHPILSDRQFCSYGAAIDRHRGFPLLHRALESCVHNVIVGGEH